MQGDLHCHTKLSDGSLGIEDLITLAKRRGIEAIAITDHDCLAATVRGKIIGKRAGVEVIPGVELSATDQQTGKNVHILCYLCDAPDRLEGLCHRNSLARKKAAHYMMLQLIRKYPIAPELIAKCATGSTNIFPVHMMQALMECGFAQEIHGDVYKSLFTKEGKNSILVMPKFADIEEVVTSIHDAGGIAILAHPYFYDNMDSMPRLLDCGIDGIEVWHPSATKEQQEELQKYAQKHKLLMTGGTDFHGLYNTYPVSIGDVITPQTAMEKLMGYKAKQKRLLKKQQKLAEAEAAAKAKAEAPTD